MMKTPCSRLVLGLSGLFSLLSLCRGDVLINEFLAANSSGLLDSDGDRPDWIELYNTGPATVSLEGWTLTDDPANPAKWTFPGVFLNKGAYLVVFASGKNRVNPAAALHTNFSLDANGEYLALFPPDSVVPVSEFAPAFAPQKPDVSFGTVSGRNYFFSPPSPGAANTGGFADFVADTKFSHDRGFYDTGFSLTISSATPSAVIRYTLDGTVPTLSNGQTYSAPIAISKTAVVRAAAFKDGLQPSNVDTHTFMFLDDVIKQAPDGKAPPGWPASWGANTVDYGMDPDVVNSALYKNTLKNDMKTLPSFCVTVKLSDLFDSSTGIYANASQDGRPWERPCSLELVNPDGTKGFQIDAGIRIRGGFSRSTGNPKHAFRFFFRDQYGAGKLKYPLFGDGGTDTFDGIDLRTFQNYSWSFQGDSRGIFMRDQFSRDTQLAMGWPAERGNYYHLYINGYYWGLYNTCERAEASYGETYIGGAKEEYDTIKVEAGPYTIFATDGTMDGWTRLYNACKTARVTDDLYYRLQGLNPDGTRNPAYERLLDVDNLIDYMLVIIYGGNLDAPISNFLGNTSPNNWFGIWNRTGLYGGFQFFAHDAEHTLLDVNQDRTGPFSAGDSSITKSSPQWIWQQLASNPEFRLRVADRVQRHFFNGGALTPESARARLITRRDQIDRAVVAESARWGDAKTGTPFTRDNAWLPAVNQVLNNYLPSRSGVVLDQLKRYAAGGEARPLYPATVAPTFGQHGGRVIPGYKLTMSSSRGQVYYTTDGSDPRRRGGAVGATARAYLGPVTISEGVRIAMRLNDGGNWSALVEAEFTVAQDFAGLRMTEIMYNPPSGGGVDGDQFEFIELKNTGTTDLDLSGLRFTNGVAFTFPTGSRLAAGRFAVLASSLVDFTNKYPQTKVAGVFQGHLSNSGERLTLVDSAGGPILDFAFGDAVPWPLAADGTGFSLVPVQPNLNPDPGSAANWRASAAIGGSPGADDPAVAIAPVVINEVLSHTDPPMLDYIEFHNPGAAEVSIGGWWISDDWGQPKKFRIPVGKTIPGGGYLVLDESDFNSPPGGPNAFTFSSHGDEAILSSANAAGDLTGFSDAVRFAAASTAASFGRFTNSIGEIQFPLMAARTPKAPNGSPATPSVVLNEVLYAPLPGGVEFVELRNDSAAPVPLFDPLHKTNTWRLNGADFYFPPDITLPVGGYAVVVSGDPSIFRSLFGIPASVPVFGPFNGSLQDGGELLELQRPDPPDLVTNGVLVTTFVPYVTVDAVRYDSQAPWPSAAAGNGASLERKVPARYGNDPAAWQASAVAPSPGTANDSNRAPQADAGPDQDLFAQTYPVAVPLSAKASDDGRPTSPGKLAFSWSQVGGPSGVVLSDPTILSPSVSLPGQGVYTLRLVVSDGDRSVSDDVVLSVHRQEGLVTVLPFGSTWKYLDSGPDPGTAWRARDFADGSWKSGQAQLGYSEGQENDEKTLLDFGGNSGDKRIAYYFRLAFNLSGVAGVSELVGHLVRDDGAVVWLNGQLAFRDNMPEQEPTFTTRASASVGGADESAVFDHPMDPALLVEGRNVLAVEVHQNSPTSSDISFDLSIGARIAAVNAKPTANAGLDQSITQPAPVSLIATFTDDGLPAQPGVPSFVWSKVSGPGTVTFATADSPKTQATFSTAGTYVLRFSVNDGVLGATDDISVTVKPGVAPVPPVVGIRPGAVPELQVTTVAGQSYTIQFQDGLTGGSWTRLQDLPAEGAGRIVAIPLTGSAGAARFFRVVTPAAP